MSNCLNCNYVCKSNGQLNLITLYYYCKQNDVSMNAQAVRDFLLSKIIIPKFVNDYVSSVFSNEEEKTAKYYSNLLSVGSSK